jgi:hypothetical protein
VNRIVISLVLVSIFLLNCLALADSPIPPDPIYMRIDNGWKGFYARNDEFVEYAIVNTEVKLQDPYHILIKPGLGLMVTFADKKEIGVGKDILESHKQWEIAYWNKKARKVESANRNDLIGTRRDMMVTELSIYGQNADQFIRIYQIVIASQNGVYVFAISPADKDIDELVKAFISTVKLVNKRFDVKEETAKIRRGAKNSEN